MSALVHVLRNGRLLCPAPDGQHQAVAWNDPIAEALVTCPLCDAALALIPKQQRASVGIEIRRFDDTDKIEMRQGGPAPDLACKHNLVNGGTFYTCTKCGGDFPVVAKP